MHHHYHNASLCPPAASKKEGIWCCHVAVHKVCQPLNHDFWLPSHYQMSVFGKRKKCRHALWMSPKLSILESHFYTARKYKREILVCLPQAMGVMTKIIKYVRLYPWLLTSLMSSNVSIWWTPPSWKVLTYFIDDPKPWESWQKSWWRHGSSAASLWLFLDKFVPADGNLYQLLTTLSPIKLLTYFMYVP